VTKVAVVTGANQGLGLALVEALCRTCGPNAAVYLTARNRERGEAAVAHIRELGLNPVFYRVDVTDESTIHDFADMLRTRHGGVDIVIANHTARMRPGRQKEDVRAFIDTNNHGNFRLKRHLGPLLRDGARYIEIASSHGVLTGHADKEHPRMDHIKKLFGSNLCLDPRHYPKFDPDIVTLEAIEAELDTYVKLVESGEAAVQGWPDWINIPSKIGQVAAIKVFARDMEAVARDRKILINAVDPGFMATEAATAVGLDISTAQSAAQAAVDILWLATLPPACNEPYGELIAHRNIVPFR
jgi:NAD(P)-dependent dehydrogenase (short-subunit alcohol dehydrogenase family)